MKLSVGSIASAVADANPYTAQASSFLGGGSSSNLALSFIPGVGDYMATKDANQASLTSAREQMAFQERMSNTGYQRATADLKAAGLNPMLAYTQGPASTPSGAMADIQPATRTGLAKSLMDAYGLNTQAKTAKAQIALNEATAATQTKQAQLVEQNAKIAANDVKISSAKAAAQEKISDFEKHKAEVDKDWYSTEKKLRAASEGMGIVGNAVGALNPLKRLLPNKSSKGTGLKEFELN